MVSKAARSPLSEGASKDGRPAKWTRRDAEENRARLIEVAAEVFAERGLDVTLDQIAARAGLAVGTMYRNFPSKAALIEVVFEHRGAQFAQVAHDANAHEDSWEGLVYFVEGMNTLMAGDRGLRDVFMSTRDGAEGIARTRDEYGPAVEQLIARAKADGYLRAEVERTDLFMVDVMIDAARSYAGPVDAEQWRRCLAVVLAGLRRQPSTDVAELPGSALSPAELERAMREAAVRR
ncbi:TetR/AcrR family transcriptional regulator [Amycolatopsis sp. H6(2020)]|nr:TetR/AcrR family transcriptional regulator [Amycolatopsis sp. H6(2020)]